MAWVPHIKISFMKRYINFTTKLSCSAKECVKTLFHMIKNDCRSTTGRNLRAISKHCGKPAFTYTTDKEVSQMRYHLPHNADELFNTKVVKLLIEVRDKKCELTNWENVEVTECIRYLTTT